MQKLRLGVVGAGQMATALARAWLAADLVERTHLRAADPNADARQRFSDATGAPTVKSNSEAVAGAEIVLLAVKPQTLAAIGRDLRGQLDGKLVISILAGVTLVNLAEVFGDGVRLVRVMPNTPCLVGEGASGFARGAGASDDDVRLARSLLEAVGLAVEVDESLLDAVTGLSGSGPAFAFLMIEALSDGGVRMGLSRPLATALAAQTLRGAATMVQRIGEHPAALRDRVTSPGGTTIAGVQALEEHGVRAGLMAAVEAATRRSAELGR